MANYSIKDLEKLSGIKAHTLRIWEKRYNLVEPKRTETNIRYYDDEDLKKILNVALLNKNGFKISRIAQFGDEELKSKINNLSQKDHVTENTIDKMVIAMIELDEKKFEKVLSTSIIQSGFEETILHTIYPFFEKIGILWQTGAINPAQEHFITNLVRQKLIVAIDGIIEKDHESPKRFILFLPEGELHEIGLLFYYYLIKKRGHKTIYLGQSVPTQDLKRVIDIKPCDFIFTSFSSTITGINIEKYLQKLANQFSDRTIMFSSFNQDLTEKQLPPNARKINNAIEFVEFLDALN